MGVELYKEINLVSIKSIYVILNVSRKEMIYWHVIWCFLIEILDCKCHVKNISYSLKPTNIGVKFQKRV